MLRCACKSYLPTESPRSDELDRVARVLTASAGVGVDFSESERPLIFRIATLFARVAARKNGDVATTKGCCLT
jgi:hypothetical protein